MRSGSEHNYPETVWLWDEVCGYNVKLAFFHLSFRMCVRLTSQQQSLQDFVLGASSVECSSLLLLHRVYSLGMGMITQSV